MSTDQLNAALYDKMSLEQEIFRDRLYSMTAQEALSHAYEYVVREDILLCLEYHDLNDRQAAALLRSPTPLADVYRDFEKRETDRMACIRDTIESRANTLIKNSNRKKGGR